MAEKHRFKIGLFFFILLYIIYFTTASFLRHDNFYTGRYDLGNMDQTVWNSSQGRPFQANDDNGAVISRLSSHADVILVPLSPLYLMWSDPKMLLVAQTIVLGLGGYIVFLLAKKILQSNILALAFGFAFLINPHVQHTNLYDFHSVTFATTLLLTAFYFLLEKKYTWFLPFAFLAGITKEQVWVILALLGMYIALFTKKRLFGSLFFLISIGIFYLLIWKIIPYHRGEQHFALSYYQDFGDSPSAIAKNVPLSSYKVLSIVLEPDRLQYLKQLFLPLGFTSLIAPFFLVFALPDLAINLLGNNTNLHQIYYHYTATITPFLFIASIYGIRTVQRFTTISPNIYAFYLLSFSIYAAYSFGPLPGAKNPNSTMFTKPQENKEVIEAALSLVPQDASVAATNNIGAHLSQREKLFTIPVGIAEADYIVFLFGDVFAQPSPKIQRQMAEKLLLDSSFTVVAKTHDFIMFVRKK